MSNNSSKHIGSDQRKVVTCGSPVYVVCGCVQHIGSYLSIESRVQSKATVVWKQVWYTVQELDQEGLMVRPRTEQKSLAVRECNVSPKPVPSFLFLGPVMETERQTPGGGGRRYCLRSTSFWYP